MSSKGPRKGPNTAQGRPEQKRPPARPGTPHVEQSSGKVVLPETGQLIGRTIRLLGGNHLEVQCADDKVRVIRIPGKIRRRMWVKVGDIVVIEPWYGLQDDDKGDLKYRYRKTELRALSKNKRCMEALIKLEVTIPKEESGYGIDNVDADIPKEE